MLRSGYCRTDHAKAAAPAQVGRGDDRESAGVSKSEKLVHTVTTIRSAGVK